MTIRKNRIVLLTIELTIQNYHFRFMIWISVETVLFESVTLRTRTYHTRTYRASYVSTNSYATSICMHYTHVSTTHTYIITNIHLIQLSNIRKKVSTKILLCRCCTVAPDEIYEQYNILFVQGIFFVFHKSSECVLDKIHLRVTGKKIMFFFFVRLGWKKT